MIDVEIANRSGESIDEHEVRAVCEGVMSTEGVTGGELGVWIVGPDEARALKREHLGIDDVGDVLSFPIDGAGPLPAGEPRALGDIFLCPAALHEGVRGALVHGLLHLLGYEHGSAMERREAELVA